MTGDELKTIRKRLNIQQLQLAQMLGLTAQTIVRYEAGAVPIVVEYAIRYLLGNALFMFDIPKSTRTRTDNVIPPQSKKSKKLVSPQSDNSRGRSRSILARPSNSIEFTPSYSDDE